MAARDPSLPLSRTSRRSPETPSLLTSRENRWLKEFRMALRGGVPTPSGCVGVEGVRLVEEALRSGCRVEAVLFSESGDRHRPRVAPYLEGAAGIPVLRTTDRLFEGLADTEHPQGIAALVEPRPSSSLEDLLRARPEVAPLLVVLVGVQDPGNVGTILRTAAAFGATGGIVCASGRSGTANPYSPKALRASAGAALHLPMLVGMSLPILLLQLRLSEVRSLASSVREPLPEEPPFLRPWEVDWRERVALLVGNEGAGLPEEAERSVDARIHIPMVPGMDSLNTAAAAAVLFYEAARQRKLLSANGGANP